MICIRSSQLPKSSENQISKDQLKNGSKRWNTKARYSDNYKKDEEKPLLEPHPRRIWCANYPHQPTIETTHYIHNTAAENSHLFPIKHNLDQEPPILKQQSQKQNKGFRSMLIWIRLNWEGDCSGGNQETVAEWHQLLGLSKQSLEEEECVKNRNHI